MKKHLIAAAVAAAVAAPAMAQNVTLYGIIDQAYGRFDSGAASNATWTGSTQNLLSTQRLGFRGSEDLGGGLKANFQIEGTLSSDAASAGSSTNTTGFLNTSREMWVGLSGNFGAVKVGRTDLGTTNIDDAVSQAGNLGAMLTTTPTSDLTRDGLGNDKGSSVVYTTPNFSGFTVELGYTGKTSGAATTGSSNGIRADYRNGPLLVAAGRTRAKSSDSLTVNATLSALGASYDFGVVSVGFARVEAKPNANSKYVYDLLSAAMPIGNGFTIHGVYQQAELKGSTAEADGYTLAVTKAMSKRTTVYAAYSSMDNDGTGEFGMRGTGAPSGAGRDPSAFAVGIRHSF
jgi:predicted porin